MIDEDILQWFAIIVLLIWNLALSVWVGETTNLLKSWWHDFLKDLVAKHYHDTLVRTTSWLDKQ